LRGKGLFQQPQFCLLSSKELHSVQAQSLEVGPQVPTWMAEREQTLWAPLWWAQLETEHLMLLLAFMLEFMGKSSFGLVCP
jgi:hypothetical protein